MSHGHRPSPYPKHKPDRSENNNRWRQRDRQHQRGWSEQRQSFGSPTSMRYDDRGDRAGQRRQEADYRHGARPPDSWGRSESRGRHESRDGDGGRRRDATGQRRQEADYRHGARPPDSRGRSESRERHESRDGDGGRRGDARQVPGCDKCPKLPFCTITLEKELEYFTIGKLSKKIGKFMEAVNAMMNEKGGGIIIHVKEGNQNLLGHLDQKIDDRLVQLIPDDSLFHDKFERYFYDRSHIVYRVKPGPKDRHISTLYFNSKVSVNKGKADPSHAQMRALMTNASKEVKSEQPNMKSEKPNILFIDGEQVEIKRSNFHEPFQESMLLQAKSAPNLPAEEEHTRVQELMKYCWERVRIQEYISAFSKIPEGGSIYIGVTEEDTEVKKWAPVQGGEANSILTVHDNTYQIWKEENADEENGDNIGVYHVAKAEAVPNKKQRQTGKFLCQGLRLTPTEQDRFRQSIQTNIRDKMLWLGCSKPEVPVTVHFHKVENCTDKYVIEIRVKFFPGVSFHEETGPVSYRCSGPTGPPQQIPVEDWVSRVVGATRDEAQEKGTPYPEKQEPQFS